MKLNYIYSIIFALISIPTLHAMEAGNQSQTESSKDQISEVTTKTEELSLTSLPAEMHTHIAAHAPDCDTSDLMFHMRYQEVPTQFFDGFSQYAMCPENKHLALFGYDTVMFWDLENKKELAHLTKKDIYGFDTLLEPSAILSGKLSHDSNEQIKIPECQHTLAKYTFMDKGDYSRPAKHPKENTAFFIKRGNKIKHIDLTNHQVIHERSAARDTAFDKIVVSPDGSRLAILVRYTEELKYIVEIWDTKQFIPLCTLKLHSGIKSMTFSPDSQHLAIGFLTGLKVYDANTFKQVYELHEGENFAKVISNNNVTAFSPDGRYLAYSHYHNLIIWDTISKKCVDKIRIHKKNSWHDEVIAKSLTFSPDYNYIIGCTGSDTWIAETDRLKFMINKPQKSIHAQQFIEALANHFKTSVPREAMLTYSKTSPYVLNTLYDLYSFHYALPAYVRQVYQYFVKLSPELKEQVKALKEKAKNSSNNNSK